MKYDFRCPQGHAFVIDIPIDSFTTNHTVECPDCGKDSRRAFTQAPTQFVRMDWWDVAMGPDSRTERKSLRGSRNK